MKLDGSDQFRVGFEWICQNLMAREQWERDIGGFCLGSVGSTLAYNYRTDGWEKGHSLFVTTSLCLCCKLLFESALADHFVVFKDLFAFTISLT